MATPFTIAIGTDVGEIAVALGNFAKLGGDILGVLNNPQVIAARQQAEAQKQRDEDALAVTKAKDGDLTELRERSS